MCNSRSPNFSIGGRFCTLFLWKLTYCSIIIKLTNDYLNLKRLSRVFTYDYESQNSTSIQQLVSKCYV